MSIATGEPKGRVVVITLARTYDNDLRGLREYVYSAVVIDRARVFSIETHEETCIRVTMQGGVERHSFHVCRSADPGARAFRDRVVDSIVNEDGDVIWSGHYDSGLVRVPDAPERKP